MQINGVLRHLREGRGKCLGRSRRTESDLMSESARPTTLRRARRLADELKARGFVYDDPVLRIESP